MLHTDKNEVYARRLALEKALFKYHNLPFPKVFIGESTSGQFADPCCNSYHMLIQHAIDEDMPFVFSLENDAYPCNGILQRLKDFLVAGVPNDAKMCQLGWIYNKNKINADVHVQKADDIVQGTQATIIFKDGYEDILKLLEQKKYIDKCQNELGHCYFSTMLMFIQYNFAVSKYSIGSYFMNWMSDADRQFMYNNYTPVEDILANECCREFIKNEDIHLFLHRNNVNCKSSWKTRKSDNI